MLELKSKGHRAIFSRLGAKLVSFYTDGIDVVVDGASKPLVAGQLMYLSGGVPHSLTAVVDASVLVTIAFCR